MHQHLWQQQDALEERLQSVRKSVCFLYNRKIDNIEYGRKRLKLNVEKELKEEDNINLTATENERAKKQAYTSFDTWDS